MNTLGKAPWGPVLFNSRDRNLGACLREYGEFSEGELDVLRQVVPVEGHVIDVGANIGAIAVPLAQHVGRKGVVIAFEPQRLMFQTLCANAALNSIPNLLAINAAVGSTQGKIRVPFLDPDIEGSPGSISLLPGLITGPCEQAPLVTIDSMHLARVDLIKIDVEGMEADVVAGATETIQRQRPALYVENDRMESSVALIAAIQALGYRMWWHLPFLVNPDVSGLTPGIGSAISSNMLCLPQEMDAKVDMEPVLPDDDATIAQNRIRARAA